jgi:hypothetical protein
MKNETNLSIGQRVNYNVAADKFDCRHPALSLSGEIIKSEFDGKLAFRPDSSHAETLYKLGFDEDATAAEGLPLDWAEVTAAE